MSASSACLLKSTLTPFLYPFSRSELRHAARFARRFETPRCLRRSSTIAAHRDQDDVLPSRLDPTPDDYSSTPFTDHCTITIHAGGGGNGCVSFLREKYVENGGPNGGDGGAGGNIYVQAIRGETSLHKIARRREVKAGRGKNGKGSSQNGSKGADVVITVPVGTVIRELARHDPVAIEEEEYLEEQSQQKAVGKSKKVERRERLEKEAERHRAIKMARHREKMGIPKSGFGQELEQDIDEEDEDEMNDSFSGRNRRKEKKAKQQGLLEDVEDKLDEEQEETTWNSEYVGRKEGETADPLDVFGPARRDKWLMFPGEDPSRLWTQELPQLPPPRRSNLTAIAPEAPMQLNLDEHMETPMLLAPGAMGGYGNPYFLTRNQPLPKIATKGDGGLKIVLHLELKLLADVGLVGLPNAGKSTLLRAVTNSRTRVGNWAFTTLQPSIGTVVLDDHKGRSNLQHLARKSGRTRFTIADIPGVIEDAHLDKGLGLSFLRHIERARVLAFVVDLSAGDAVTALKALWREVAEYEDLGGKRLEEQDAQVLDWQPSAPKGLALADLNPEEEDQMIFEAEKNLPALTLQPMTEKPWFVVATKADKPETQENFLRLQNYVESVRQGAVKHPSRKEGAWRKNAQAVPISGIRGEGVERIPEVVVEMLMHS